MGATKKMDATIILSGPVPRDLVQALLADHASGNVEAGNIAFEVGDLLAKEIAGCSVNELADKYKDHGYRPTLRGSLRAEILADVYDYVMVRRGETATAFRGGANPGSKAKTASADALDRIQRLAKDQGEVQIAFDPKSERWELTLYPRAGGRFRYTGPHLAALIARAWAGEPDDDKVRS